jgi:hypothetical protein
MAGMQTMPPRMWIGPLAMVCGGMRHPAPLILR